MKWSTAAVGLAATAYAAPQGGAVTDDIAPEGGIPDACSKNFDGQFQVTVFKKPESKEKRDAMMEKRDACSGDHTLLLNLHDGVLKDGKDRTGYVASNYQFQFDGPAQAGAIYTAGFSVCGNGSLALGSSTTFYQCLSGDFYNLYDRSWAEQCEPVEIIAMPCSGSDSNQGGNGNQGDQGDQGNQGGKTVGTSMMETTIVTQIGDGQPQNVPTTVGIPLCQIGDGQVQAKTTRCDELPPVTQIGDGQVQAPTNAPTGGPVTQIGDGQIQAPTGAPVSQIDDGQIQAPSNPPDAPPVSQIDDGQIQAPTGAPTGAPITQIDDGQIQAPTGNPTGPPVTQISDGQIQAPTDAPSAVPTGAGANIIPGTAGVIVAAVGAVLFL